MERNSKITNDCRQFPKVLEIVEGYLSCLSAACVSLYSMPCGLRCEFAIRGLYKSINRTSRDITGRRKLHRVLVPRSTLGLHSSL
jgi:hypothetical protein